MKGCDFTMKYVDLIGLTSFKDNIISIFTNTISTHNTSGIAHKDIRDKIDNINDTIGYINDDEFINAIGAGASPSSANTAKE